MHGNHEKIVCLVFFSTQESINYGPMVRVSDVREGYNWSESERACIYLIRYLLLEKWVHSI